MADFLNPDEEITKGRHKLPHWQQGSAWVFLTYRLADSLPEAKLHSWRDERTIWIERHPEPWNDATENEYHERFSEAIDHWLDQGHGSCLLQSPDNSRIVADAFHHFDGDRYQLSNFVVMPNHVHVLFRPFADHQLPELVHSWKRFTALEINKRESRNGTLWQPEYWDRLMRNQRHFDRTQRYIQENPKHLLQGNYRLWPE